MWRTRPVAGFGDAATPHHFRRALSRHETQIPHQPLATVLPSESGSGTQRRCRHRSLAAAREGSPDPLCSIGAFQSNPDVHRLFIDGPSWGLRFRPMDFQLRIPRARTRCACPSQRTTDSRTDHWPRGQSARAADRRHLARTATRRAWHTGAGVRLLGALLRGKRSP
jgi:hypothetical protein